ncbi:homoserine O-acetyltransferase [Synechococcus elongatus PCC 6301]|uniref:Homoserine O-acetyltransferase n=1 Tax=Synechococcus sp. (strain ATCC 27144 / PCC 6301 / SAUG 1402/1) TaxID=269084 RepID=A0A0H3K563_SYNP6|nr:alpha/beta fold hydrolase [Synechococcus elongatus]BAD80567.1 homoserine O-acetyltransferase [Synechococcus elongatus PCC 6301]
MTVGTFRLPNFELDCGAVLPEASLVYATYGELNRDRSNAILYPTSYGAQHSTIDWLIGGDRILDPDRWFIVIVNQFGNGLSSSPSNDPACGLAEQGFWFSHWDSVCAQQALLSQVLGIEQLALIHGWSMGAQQAYHWAIAFPDRVQRIAALCGTAKTTEHNRLFLESLRAALIADPTWDGQRFQATPDRGYKAFARIYASWAASQAFYRAGIYRQQGYSSLEDYLERGWEANYRQRDPHDLLAMIDTWLRCDVSDRPAFGGDLAKALGSITAQTLVMPSTTDLYFTPEDCEAEAQLIPKAHYCPIPSIWGHRAGNPSQNPQDESFIRQAVQALLNAEA